MNTEAYDPEVQYPSEGAKYLSLTRQYLHGLTLDLGSGGWPIVPHAIQVELPSDQFNAYTGGRKPAFPIQIHGDIANLPFKDSSVDAIHCSHLIEDYSRDQWEPFFREWKRVIKPTGFIVILIPEHERWQYCVQVLGQCPNCSHYNPEPSVGDITRIAQRVGLKVKEERLTELFPNDYSILGVLTK